MAFFISCKRKQYSFVMSRYMTCILIVMALGMLLRICKWKLIPMKLYTSSYQVAYNNAQRHNMPTLIDDVTVVTAYINIGSFSKGNSQKKYTTDLYYHWMKVFTSMKNPVVAFFDNDEDATFFKHLRKHRNNTKIIVFTRNSTWSFSLLPQIKNIISQPGYPKHMPNTVVPEYQSIQHIKYEFMKNVSTENYFKTRYIAWCDIGLFRHLTDTNMDIKPFKLYIPLNYDPNKIAYNEVTAPLNITTKDIFYKNLYWVCGCFFIGSVQTMVKWTHEYMNHVQKYLEQGLANTDQRVIYAMQINGNPNVKVQPYKPRGRHNVWFHLAYHCKDRGQAN